MGKNKVIFISIFAMIILLNIPVVKAEFSIEMGLSNGNNESGYYSNKNYVIEASQGDIISVYAYYDNWSDTCKDDGNGYCEFFLEQSHLNIHYSKELTFVDAKVNKDLKNKVYLDNDASDSSGMNGYGIIRSDYWIKNSNGKPSYSFTGGFVKLIEYRFKINSNVENGVYTINLTYSNSPVKYYDSSEDDYSTVNIGGYVNDNIQVIVGTEPISVDSGCVPNNTYIIGKYMFTNNVSSAYNGQLTTQHIMRAAKSNDSVDLSKMIIYYKNARGKWVNAINNKSVTPPQTFNIIYRDMKTAEDIYNFNGVYKSDSNTAEIKIYDLPDNHVQMIISGVGQSMPDGAVTSIYREVYAKKNDGTISFDMYGKKYSIAKRKNQIILTSSDEVNLPSGTYTYKKSYNIDDYYKDAFFEANSASIETNQFNALYTRSDGAKMYMISDNSRENIAFIFPNGEREYIRLRIEGDQQTGESKLVSWYDDEDYYSATYDSNTKEYVIKEYDSKKNELSDSKIAGTYSFKKYLTVESIINEVHFLDLNKSIIINN